MAIINLNTIKAFPGAEGFGKTATGGKGGNVIFVTNLNASGAGSLRSALEASGARTVIFRVGGTIDLGGGVISIANPNITIAGETAPGDGIVIKDGSIRIDASNVIMRHIRFRHSVDPSSQLRIKGSDPKYSFSIENIIIDHCSFAWAEDQTWTASISKNVTFQNNIIAHAIKSYLVWASKDVSILNNVTALVDTRHPTVNQQQGTYLQYEFINNLVYGFNWGSSHGYGMMGTIENNIYEGSNSFSGTSNTAITFTAINPDYIGESNIEELTYLYHSGNVIDGTSITNLITTPDGSWIKGTPLYRSTYTPKATVGLKDSLLSRAGAFWWNRDAVDQNVINHINAKTGTLDKTVTYPTIASGTPYIDSNNDGISDSWAATHGISSASQVKPTYTIGGHTINNNAGYTALEIFLADMAGDFELLAGEPSNNIPVITLTGASTINLNVGDTYTELGATATDAEDGNITGSIIVTGTVNTAISGTYYKYYNVTDSNSNAAVQVVRTIIVSEPGAVTNKIGVHKNLFWSI